jgi:hypothetical protein
MIYLNGDLIFGESSGQIVASTGSLTLRADSTGTGSIIAGSGLSLRPDRDNFMTLGQQDNRWSNIFAGSGTFSQRPSVGGSGIEFGVSRGLSIVSPTSSENVTIISNIDQTRTIKSITAILYGTTPSITWTLRVGSDRSAAGTEVITGGTTTTNTTSGHTLITFNAPNLIPGNHLWLVISAKSGTVSEFHLTILLA